MDWARVGEDGMFGIPGAWLPFIASWLFLILLAALEAAWPLRRTPGGTQKRLLANFGLGIVNGLIGTLLPVSTFIVAEWAGGRGIGLLNWLKVPALPAAAATFLLLSLLLYGMHVLAHRVPVLWRMHQIHHSDVEVDLSTGVRHHPLEPIYNGLVIAGLAVLFGMSPAGIAAYAIVAGIFALWTHTNVRLPDRVESGLKRALMTPAAHAVHHSARREETDSNYGDVLMIWDRLFGTYHAMPQRDVPAMRLGLGDAHEAGAGDIVAQLRLPFARRPEA